ncbi:hypothetical protein ACHAQH_009498, partial [Verticillium albo-atrum]
MQAYCPVVNYQYPAEKHIKENWAMFSTTDIDLLKGCLLAACRHLSLVHQESEYEDFALQYKLNILASMRSTTWKGDMAASRSAVTKAMVLAFDEMMLHDLCTASKHARGAVHIIEAAGGIQSMGLTDIVRFMLHNVIYVKRLVFEEWDPETKCNT